MQVVGAYGLRARAGPSAYGPGMWASQYKRRCRLPKLAGNAVSCSDGHTMAKQLGTIRAHKIALDPCKAQRLYFAKAAGVARFAYNWALAEWKRQYEAGLKPSEFKLRKELNAIKAVQYPWMLEVTKTAPQYAIKNLGVAFKSFFAKRGSYPEFKKKGKSRESFRADDGPEDSNSSAVRVQGKRVKLPIIGWIRMRETPRFEGRIISATVSRTADRWFVSLQIEVDHTVPVRENQATVGVDLGVKALATLSDGTVVEGPKALKRNLTKLRRLSRAHSRKKRGSANRKKSAMKLARLHARITNLRNDALHKLTHSLVSRFTLIVIEDLNVQGMMANRRLARAIADVGMGEFRRQLEYKAKLYGSEIVVADRWYASSKTCSKCGERNGRLSLSDRRWRCICGADHDRDVNAAINLRKLAGSSSVTACGVSGLALKQELTAGMFVHA